MNPNEYKNCRISIFYKRLLNVILLIFLIVKTSFSQSTVDLWPVQGKSAGENIILKPNQYIGDELNVEGIVISTQEGTNIVAPKDGVIVHVGYQYLRNLRGSLGFHDSLYWASNVEKYDKEFRNSIAGRVKGIDPEYIFMGMTISVGAKEKYYISGIRPIRKFKSGDKVKRGDIIGKAAYYYRLIKHSAICISRSKNDSLADPMSMFGLKSTFIPFKRDTIDYSTYKIPVDNLKQDFQVFRESLEEGHPGLYDYTLKASMDKMFEQALFNITKPMTSLKFLKLLHPIIDSIRDSHTVFKQGWQEKKVIKSSENGIISLPIKFGLLKDSLIVFRAMNGYSEYIGKKIIAIDGIGIDSIRRKTKCYDVIYSDGYITGQTQYFFMRKFALYYLLSFHKQKGDKVSIAFSDGSKADFVYQTASPFVYPSLKKSMCVTEKFHLEKLNNQTALITLNTFDLLNSEEDSIAKFIIDIAALQYKNLIIDLRDNRGGAESTLSKLYSYIANEPFRTSISSMVNKNDNYKFFKYSSNYPTDYNNIYGEYVKVAGKSGYYLPIEKIPLISPNGSIHFNGNIYVLTNEYSQSASTIFAGLVHKYKRGLIIGRETGSAYHQMNASEFVKVKLQNSALELQFPLQKEILCDRSNSDIPWGRGVIPDYFVDFSFDELFEEKTDKMLNYTLNIISGQNKVVNAN